MRLFLVVVLSLFSSYVAAMLPPKVLHALELQHSTFPFEPASECKMRWFSIYDDNQTDIILVAIDDDADAKYQVWDVSNNKNVNYTGTMSEGELKEIRSVSMWNTGTVHR